MTDEPDTVYVKEFRMAYVLPTGEHLPISDEALVPLVEAARRRTRKRRVTIDRAMRQAAKAGVSVSAATITADGGVTLSLGEGQADRNEWDDVR